MLSLALFVWSFISWYRPFTLSAIILPATTNVVVVSLTAAKPSLLISVADFRWFSRFSEIIF
jgi:hypothetical protein